MLSLVTLSGQPARLLHSEPNTSAAVRLEVALPVASQRGLTGRSSRRPSALLPRYTQSWTSLLEAADFTTLRDASLALQAEPILVPIWQHTWRPATETATLQGGLTIGWTEGWGTWEVNPANLALYDFAAPLLHGRFTQPPRLVSLSGALVQAQFEIVEDGPAEYAVTPVAGLLPADTLSGGHPLFPFAALADWSRAPSPGLAVTDLTRLATGPGRMQATIFYPQTPERIFTASLTAVGRTEAAQLIAWWLRRGGTAGAHQVPLADLGVQNGGTILARHTNDRLTLDHAGPLATVELAWREVAAEATIPAGETVGLTLGQLPAEAWFFQIDLDYSGATQTWRLTNWESGATANGLAWTYNPCDFDRLLQSIDLEDDSCTLTARWFPGGPWEHWLPGRLAARGWLTLYRADVSPAGAFTNFAQVFRGELGKPTFDGPLVKQPATGANALFGRQVPHQLMTTFCRTNLFKPRCVLAVADWTINARLAAVAGHIITLDTLTRANGAALPTGFGGVNWFALGWVGWVAAGLTQRAGVLSSTALAVGAVQLTLDRVCPLAVGATLTAVPGCDRLFSTCLGKFANTENYRGYDQMPSVSPNFVLPQRNTAASKK